MSGRADRDWGLGGRDAYEVLGVRDDAPAAEIKHAYRKAVRETHPDVTGGQDPEAEERFRLVAAAYKALTERRTDYDAFRAHPAAEEDEALDIDDPWNEAHAVQDDPWEWADDGPEPPPPRPSAMTKVVFRRPWRYVESARSYALKIDGVLIGRIRAGKEFTVTVPPGVHTAEAGISLNQGQSSNLPIEFIAHPGQVLRIRVDPPNLQDALSNPFDRTRRLRLEDG